MKIRHIILGVLAVATMYSCDNSQPTDASVVSGEGTYAVDTEKSSVTWNGAMLGIKSHTGILKLSEGSLELKDGKVSGGNFKADLKSMVPTDENYDEEYTPDKLVGHLLSADFFSAEEFPTASFVVKNVDGNNIIGDLTVRGKTNEEKVTGVVIEETAEGVKASGKLVFDRQKYDVAWTSPMKEMVLSDEISLDIVLNAKN